MADEPLSYLQNSWQGSKSSPVAHRTRTVPKTEALAVSLAGISQQEDIRPKQKCVVNKPQSARALLEENKQLVLKKQEERLRARKNSRDFVNKLIADDQKVIEEEKARESGRRMAQKELARYYKTRIAEKETEKANCYRSKLESGSGSHFFPYVEGEKINEERKLRNAQAREEMRGFLKDQRDTKPPRVERLMNGDLNYYNQYVDMPSERGSEKMQASCPSGPSVSNSPLCTKSPVFLMRSREHMSRRIRDEHVRRALEDKVERTKEELERRMKDGQQEVKQFEEGMLVNDALRYDSSLSQAVDRKKNAEFLLQQMEERRRKDTKDIQDRRAEGVGYFGPEEKGLPSARPDIEHCTALIEQMQGKQRRQLSSARRGLEEERSLVQNALAEISQDRELERQKYMQHREVLVTTWDSQRKIREVMKRIEDHS